MVKKNYFTCFMLFCSFTLLVSGEKNILPNFANGQEPRPGFFCPLELELELELEPEPLEKNTRSRSLSRLKKKLAGSPALEKKRLYMKRKTKTKDCFKVFTSVCNINTMRGLYTGNFNFYTFTFIFIIHT